MDRKDPLPMGLFLGTPICINHEMDPLYFIFLSLNATILRACDVFYMCQCLLTISTGRVLCVLGKVGMSYMLSSHDALETMIISNETNNWTSWKFPQAQYGHWSIAKDCPAASLMFCSLFGWPHFLCKMVEFF